MHGAIDLDLASRFAFLTCILCMYTLPLNLTSFWCLHTDCVRGPTKPKCCRAKQPCCRGDHACHSGHCQTHCRSTFLLGRGHRVLLPYMSEPHVRTCLPDCHSFQASRGYAVLPSRRMYIITGIFMYATAVVSKLHVRWAAVCAELPQSS